jgi:hypothetical protein
MLTRWQRCNRALVLLGKAIKVTKHMHPLEDRVKAVPRRTAFVAECLAVSVLDRALRTLRGSCPALGLFSCAGSLR